MVARQRSACVLLLIFLQQVERGRLVSLLPLSSHLHACTVSVLYYYGRRKQGHYNFTAANLLFFYFVSIDERPAMGSQPNLASRSEVVSIYKCPKKFWGGPPPNLGRTKHQIWTIFRDFRTRHCISQERNVASTNKKCYSAVSYTHLTLPTILRV